MKLEKTLYFEKNLLLVKNENEVHEVKGNLVGLEKLLVTPINSNLHFHYFYQVRY